MDETFVKERIGQLVADSGKSEKRISRDLGRSVGYIQSLTSGKALPSMPMLFQICEYFNIEPKDFFDPNIPCPPTIQKIRSYACHMEKDSLVTLERLSKRLCSTGQSKTNESCDSRNIHEKYDHCKRKSWGRSNPSLPFSEDYKKEDRWSLSEFILLSLNIFSRLLCSLIFLFSVIMYLVRFYSSLT